MFKWLISFILSFIISGSVHAAHVWIGMEAIVEKSLLPHLKAYSLQKISGQRENFYLINENDLLLFSKHIHHEFNRCGGYRLLSGRPSEKDLQRHLFVPNEMTIFSQVDYSINQEKQVTVATKKISEFYMNTVISRLSAFKTRYYKSPEGVAAMKWIAEEWRRLTSARTDVSIELFKHAPHDQPSVILTIKGSDESEYDNVSDQIIILGGHGDSINTDDEGIHSPAPGADDNAAGIAVLSAILKTLVEQNYRPLHTIQFMAYAAEEVGIQGSYEIAKKYREQKKQVIGVLQFDGLNYQGKSYEMALIKDNTDISQNEFLSQLLDTYLHVPWTWDQCGYACSDHAAWNYEGYRASYPLEAIKKEQNPYIHTAKDTFAISNFGSSHAKKFAQLGLAFLIELDQ